MVIKIFLSESVALMFVFFMFSSLAFGNGAVWNPGLYGVTPGPVQQKELYLEEEHVVMKDGVVQADIWVRNPTDKVIPTTMGFPITCGQNDCEEWVIDLTLKSFSVYNRDKVMNYKIIHDQDNIYRVVIIWIINYQPEVLTKFTVKYPLISGGGSTDSIMEGRVEKDIRSYGYITKTGAYWSKPIKKAKFEYCDRKNVGFLAENPSGSLNAYTDDGWYEVKKAFYVKPTTYVINENKNCIIWERNNWIPNEQDNISIEIKDIRQAYYLKALPNPRQINSLFNFWCGIDSKFNSKQFSDIVGLDKEILTKDKFQELLNVAYLYIKDIEPDNEMTYTDPFHILPDHLKTEYELILLRYLRNSIFALHGYEFKDESLLNCFRNVKNIKGGLSEVEKRNVEILQNIEKDVKRENIEAWNKVKKQTVQEAEWLN